jgi:hypothetical protein
MRKQPVKKPKSIRGVTPAEPSVETPSSDEGLSLRRTSRLRTHAEQDESESPVIRSMRHQLDRR